MEIQKLNIEIDAREFLNSYNANNLLNDRINHFHHKSRKEGDNLVWDLIIDVVSDWNSSDEENLNTLINNLVGFDELVIVEKQYSRKHMKNGPVFYNKHRSKEVQKIKKGEITSEEGFFIQEKLKDVKSNIMTGDFKTAYTYLQLTTVEGVYTQDLKNELSSDISDYINKFYE